MAKTTLAIYGIKDRNDFRYPAYVHDHNLCIMQDGVIKQYLQLERYSRRKYDNRLDLYIEELCEKKLIDLPDDFDLVCVNDFVGNAFVSKKGRLRFEADYQKNLFWGMENAHGWHQYSDWEGQGISSYLCQHEVAHICSNIVFHGDFRDNSLLVSIDGGSSLGNYSAFLYQNNKFSLIENNWNDLGYVSKFFNDNSFTFAMLGAGPGMHCSVPGKLMGFASHGTYNPDIEKWLTENNYFKDYWNREEEILQSANGRFGNVVSSFDTHNPFLQNCAATFQKMFEDAVMGKLEALQRRFHCENLYYGGGCALNIVTNTKIVESGLFRNVFVAPCCNDSGLSIGAAALLERMKGNEIKIHSPYLNNVGLEMETPVPLSNELIKECAGVLLNKGIIGVCNGNGEAGPRALGKRSLIALANSKELSQKLSMQVKKREWYRPVAPIMLKKNAQKVAVQTVSPLSKYMLFDFEVKHQFDNEMCGVIHANQTARIQTLESETDNPFMYRLLEYLSEEHGIIALINTSFNSQGEPIVHTKDDAFLSAKTMNLDALVYNNKIIRNEEL